MSLERDILVYRAYLALRKWRVVLEEVSGIQCEFNTGNKSLRISDIVKSVNLF